MTPPIDTARTYELRRWLHDYVNEIPTGELERWFERSAQVFLDEMLRRAIENQALSAQELNRRRA